MRETETKSQQLRHRALLLSLFHFVLTGRIAIGKNCYYVEENFLTLWLLYRKNPVHFKEYSHDFNKDDNSDKEEEDDNRPECPYGTDCYRKNPAHRQQFKHNVPHPPSSGAAVTVHVCV